MQATTLIFDLDGTISDPFEGISRSVNYALEALSFDTVDPERIRPMIGPPLTDIFESIVGVVGEAQMQMLVDRYRERYASIGYSENVLYDEIPEVVSSLAEAGYVLGICTSKRADYAAKIVDRFGLTAYFRFVDGGDVGIHKAEQLQRLVENGLDPKTAVMIGDRHFDIDAARMNGIRSVGVCWGFGDGGELRSAAADHVIHSPEELLALFASG